MSELSINSDGTNFQADVTMFTFRHAVPNELIRQGPAVLHQYLVREFTQALGASLLRRGS